MERVMVSRIRAQRYGYGNGSRTYCQWHRQGIKCLVESILRLDGSVHVVFFIVSLLQERPSCSDDDQASADLHHWERNPKKGEHVSPNKIRPNKQKKTIHGNAPCQCFSRASGEYSLVSARKKGLPPSGSTMGKSATRTRSRFFAASCMGPVTSFPR